MRSIIEWFKRYRREMKPKIEELRHSFFVIRKNPVTLISLLTIFTLIFIAVLAPYIVPYPQDALGEIHPHQRIEHPNMEHLFGTDEMGRDVFSRVLIGARISLAIGAMVICLSLLIGIPLGIVAGYFGGMIDEIIMRITDMFLSFPPLLLALAFSAAMGPSLVNSMIAIAIAWWPWYARMTRGQAMSIKERPFVEAARAVGISKSKIIFRHILPNSITPIVVQAAMDYGGVILAFASLSFLGLGAQPPTPEWGLMVSMGRQYFLDSWWITTFPGLFIIITVMAFSLLSDGLGEVLNPKLRRV